MYVLMHMWTCVHMSHDNSLRSDHNSFYHVRARDGIQLIRLGVRGLYQSAGPEKLIESSTGCSRLPVAAVYQES